MFATCTQRKDVFHFVELVVPVSVGQSEDTLVIVDSCTLIDNHVETVEGIQQAMGTPNLQQ